MTTQTHTPEPWDLSEGFKILIVKKWEGQFPKNVIPGPELMADYRGGHIAVLGERANDKAFATAEANARRIVACVNACAGLSNETLEHFGMGRILDRLVDHPGLQNEPVTQAILKAEGRL